VDEKTISNNFLFQPDGSCPTVYHAPSGEAKNICCQVNAEALIDGDSPLGALFLVYGIFILIFEISLWNFGLLYTNKPTLTVNANKYYFLFNKIYEKVSIIGLLHILIGIVGCTNYITFLAGMFLIANGLVKQYAALRMEIGTKKEYENFTKQNEFSFFSFFCCYNKKNDNNNNNKKNDDNNDNNNKKNNNNKYNIFKYIFNPLTNLKNFYNRIYKENKLSSYIWVFLFIIINIILFFVTLTDWFLIIKTMKNGLLNGNLDVLCDTRLCHANRKAVKFGNISDFAPWAKAFGNCLNMDCAFLIIPINHFLLRKLSNITASTTLTRTCPDLIKIFSYIKTYIPFQENLEFHKLCAITIFFFTIGHILFHLLNLLSASAATLTFFRFWGFLVY
jgi:hypothetical protein